MRYKTIKILSTQIQKQTSIAALTKGCFNRNGNLSEKSIAINSTYTFNLTIKWNKQNKILHTNAITNIKPKSTSEVRHACSNAIWLSGLTATISYVFKTGFPELSAAACWELSTTTVNRVYCLNGVVLDTPKTLRWNSTLDERQGDTLSTEDRGNKEIEQRSDSDMTPLMQRL